MVDFGDPLTTASVACLLFGIALCVRPMKLPFLRAALRIGVFAVLTGALRRAPRAPVGTAASERETRSLDERLIADAEPLSAMRADVRTKIALRAVHCLEPASQ